MLLGRNDSPQGAQLPDASVLLTETNAKAAQGALMGAVMLYTASGKTMPEWLKVSLFVAGVGSVLMNVNKIAQTPKK